MYIASGTYEPLKGLFELTGRPSKGLQPWHVHCFRNLRTLEGLFLAWQAALRTAFNLDTYFASGALEPLKGFSHKIPTKIINCVTKWKSVLQCQVCVYELWSRTQPLSRVAVCRKKTSSTKIRVCLQVFYVKLQCHFRRQFWDFFL